MSAPEDYAYLDQQTDILLTENRMQHERIAALQAQNRQLREALELAPAAFALLAKNAERWGLYEDNIKAAAKKIRAALAATEEKA